MTEQERKAIIDTLAQLLYEAARASVHRGAIYQQGEQITSDAAGAWEKAAEVLVNLARPKKEIGNG